MSWHVSMEALGALNLGSQATLLHTRILYYATLPLACTLSP